MRTVTPAIPSTCIHDLRYDATIARIRMVQMYKSSTSAKCSMPCAVLHIKAANVQNTVHMQQPNFLADDLMAGEKYSHYYMLFTSITRSCNSFNCKPFSFRQEWPAEKLEINELSNSSGNLSFNASEDVAFLRRAWCGHRLLARCRRSSCHLFI